MKRQRTLQLTLISIMALTLCAAASAQVTFTDVTEATGLGGLQGWVNWGDYDNDGDVDMVFCGSNELRLYRNEGNGTFLDVTQTAGIGNVPRASAIFLDFDNDGNLDLFVGSEQPGGSVLYRNKGDGTFLNAGIELKEVGHNFVISFDADNDGLLDIYVVGYFGNPSSPLLYHNEGNGRFTEMAAQIGLDAPTQVWYGIVLGDYDNDGDLDIFLANPGSSGTPPGTDILYRNDQGVFVNVAKEAGVEREANHDDGLFWDYDNDGDLDLFVNTLHFSEEDVNILYRNNGDGTFTDVTQPAGIIDPIGRGTWGGESYGDYDNDGWLDLVKTYNNTPIFLYHNNGDGTFTNVSQEAGIGGTDSAGVGFVDYDNDGDLDIFTGPPGNVRVALYRNEGSGNHWLQLKLVGVQSNRDAIGARVVVKAGPLDMLREKAGSSGSSSEQDRLPIYFGLEQNAKADVIEIRWPSGIIQTFTNIPANQRLTIHELEGLLVVIYNVFPTFGEPRGGTPVRIQGEYFLPGSRVFFGGVEASEVRVESPSLITAVTPPGTTGLADVLVVNPDGKRWVLKNGFWKSNI